jgi:hypothetical protein
VNIDALNDTIGTAAPVARADRSESGEHRSALKALRALPRRQREALVLRFYLDLTEADIAESDTRSWVDGNRFLATLLSANLPRNCRIACVRLLDTAQSGGGSILAASKTIFDKPLVYNIALPSGRTDWAGGHAADSVPCTRRQEKTQ